jgi:hypothetical protein
MRFMMIYRPDPNAAEGPPSAQHMADMDEFRDEMERAGALLATGGFLPAASGARVRLAGGRVTVADGARETAERIAGFAIVRAKSKQDAVALAERFLHVAGDGESEIRPLMEPPTSA